jgi:hypothetical protein
MILPRFPKSREDIENGDGISRPLGAVPKSPDYFRLGFFIKQVSSLKIHHCLEKTSTNS